MAPKKRKYCENDLLNGVLNRSRKITPEVQIALGRVEPQFKYLGAFP